MQGRHHHVGEVRLQTRLQEHGEAGLQRAALRHHSWCWFVPLGCDIRTSHDYRPQVPKDLSYVQLDPLRRRRPSRLRVAIMRMTDRTVATKSPCSRLREFTRTFWRKLRAKRLLLSNRTGMAWRPYGLVSLCPRSKGMDPQQQLQ